PRLAVERRRRRHGGADAPLLRLPRDGRDEGRGAAPRRARPAARRRRRRPHPPVRLGRIRADRRLAIAAPSRSHRAAMEWLRRGATPPLVGARLVAPSPEKLLSL